MLTISQGLIFKPHRLLSEIALQVADLLGGVHPPSPCRRGCRGAFFHKAKNNRDKMRYSNLSNNMMISKLWTTITIQIQYVNGRAAHNDTTLHQSWQSSPLPDHAGSIPGLFTWRCISFGGVKTCFLSIFK